MVVYGGVSPEHDIAIITALQVMNALKEAGFVVMPVYITREGNWYLGGERFLAPESYKHPNFLLRNAVRALLTPDSDFKLLRRGWFSFGLTDVQPDVIFPVIHGRGGEDGTLQGLLEMSGIPYVGCGVTASAIKIDKYLSKKIASACGINVLNDCLVIKGEKIAPDRLKSLKFPVMVKPVGLGSSIGLTRVERPDDLEDALEVAFRYDRRVMIEEALVGFSEVNISVMGNGPYRVSATEQPKPSGEILSFSDKYEGQSGHKGMAGARRYIPANQKKEIIKTIEKQAVEFFRAIGGKGIARVDFMVTKSGKIYFNEINTMPGSLAFYLWKASGVSFKSLVTELVDLATEESWNKNSLVKSFESGILAGFAKNGLKGSKS